MTHNLPIQRNNIPIIISPTNTYNKLSIERVFVAAQFSTEENLSFENDTCFVPWRRWDESVQFEKKSKEKIATWDEQLGDLSKSSN